MDVFLKTVQKTDTLSTKLLSFAPGILCIWGNSGSGKTWAIHNCFNKFLELDYDTLRSKQLTVNFIEKVSCTDIPILIDDWEIVKELSGISEIKGPLNKSVTIIVSTQPLDDNFPFKLYHWEDPKLEYIVEIGKKLSDDTEKIKTTAVQCGGNLHTFVSSLTFESVGERDVFQTSKNFIYELLCKGGKETVPNNVGKYLSDPGYMWAVVQENYIDAKFDTLDQYADIAENMSCAGLIDDMIYDGNWYLLPYFNIHSCMFPASMINHTLDSDKLRPGSMWTKFQNYCMRKKKLKNISRVLDVDALMVLRDYCEHGDPKMLMEYSFESQDLDILNHLAIVRKIKPKVMTQLKKLLKNK
jgi:hypothetical protein